MLKKLLKKDQGFTLIEIVIVLAIAGLILLIVFLSVAGAQRTRRDAKRKNDLGQISAQVEQFASNNNGAYPATQAAFATALGTGGPYNLANALDPLSGTAYLYTGARVPSATLSAGMTYALAGAGSRVFTIVMNLEQATQTVTNQ